METQNIVTENQAENTQTFYKLSRILENHYTFKAERNNVVVITDIEINKGEKQFYDQISVYLAKTILGEEGITVTNNENEDIVDTLIEYPNKRIYLFTDLKHLKYHYMEYVKAKIKEKVEEIFKYEEQLSSKYPHYLTIIFTNWDRPVAAGVSLFSLTLDDFLLRKIGSRILNEYFKLRQLEVDKIEEHMTEYKYVLFKRNCFVYRKKIISKYIPLELKYDYSDIDEEDKVLYPIKWFYIFEIYSKTLSRLLEP